MPEPSGDNIDDSMSVVYVLMTKQRTTDMSIGKDGVEIDKGERDKAMADAKVARQKEAANSANHGAGLFGSIEKVVKDLSRDALHGRVGDIATDAYSDVEAAAASPKFWADLESGAKYVAMAAATAATVATAGAAGPLAVGVALSLSVGGFAVSQTNCLDGLLGKNASEYIGVGMELLGSAASCVASAAAATPTAGAQFASKAGGVAGTASGSADVVAGTAHVENTKFEANVLDAEADETQATNTSTAETRLSNWLLDNLAASQQAEGAAVSTLQGIIQQHDAGKLALASITTRG